MDIRPNYYVAYLPLLLIILIGFGLSFGLIISSMTTKYRDLIFLIPVGLQILMYFSSVVFSIDIFGEHIKKYLSWNPLLWVMEGFRYATMGIGTWSWNGLCYSAVFMFVTLFFSVVIFSKIEKNFMDTV